MQCLKQDTWDGTPTIKYLHICLETRHTRNRLNHYFIFKFREANMAFSGVLKPAFVLQRVAAPRTSMN